MKTRSHFKFASLSLALFLAVGLYNCKPDETEPDIPKFEEEYNNVKLPEIKQTTPAPVTTVAGSVTTSAATAAVTTGLTAGTVTPAVTAAAADVQKVIAPAEAEKINAAFTPTVISAIASGGAIPADLKASMQAIASNPALAAYLPKVNLPAVNGTVVTGLVKDRPATKNDPLITLPDFSIAEILSPCTDTARAAYNRAKATLDAARTSQRLTVTNTYNTAIAGISPAACLATAGTNQATRNSAASTRLSSWLSYVSSLTTVEESTRTLLSLFGYTVFFEDIEASTNLYNADTAACNLAAELAIANAATARNADYATIETNYSGQITSMQSTLNASFQTCHDQGQGD